MINTFKYHVFAPMGRFQLELIYPYFPLFYYDGKTVENKGKFVDKLTIAAEQSSEPSVNIYKNKQHFKTR